MNNQPVATQDEAVRMVLEETKAHHDGMRDILTYGTSFDMHAKLRAHWGLLPDAGLLLSSLN